MPHRVPRTDWDVTASQSQPITSGPLHVGGIIIRAEWHICGPCEAFARTTVVTAYCCRRFASDSDAEPGAVRFAFFSCPQAVTRTSADSAASAPSVRSAVKGGLIPL